MIVKIKLLVLLCLYSSSADFYEINNARPSFVPYDDQNNENDLPQTSFQQLNLNPDIYLEANRRLSKHCKQGTAPAVDREWLPTFRQRVVRPSSPKYYGSYPANTDLIPQSLKETPDSDQFVEYAPSQLQNVYFDGNDESYDYIGPQNNYKLVNNEFVTDSGQNKVSNEVYRRNKNVNEEVNEKEVSSKSSLTTSSDNNNESYKSPGAFQQDAPSESQMKAKNPTATVTTLGDSTSRDTKTPENCISRKTNTAEENQSNRRLLPKDDSSSTASYSPDILANELVDTNKETNSLLNKDTTSQIAKLTLGNKNYEYDDDEVLTDPTKGSGILRLTESKMTLIKNSRVCYACSSAANPTCLLPDRRTTVKYCRKGHDSCVTKTFLTESSTVLIRDCASSCDITTSPGITPKYKSCSICHSDLCNDSNGAYSVNSRNLIVSLIVISFIKCAF